MRNFPAQVGPGGEPVSDSGSFTSSNANDVIQEEQNTITDSGQTLIPIANPADNTQLSEAVSRNAAAATFYVDSGAANVYVLTALGSFKAPSAYLDGQVVRWVADNANTTASTINSGAVGVKDLTFEDGTALAGGEVSTVNTNVARYDLANDRFILDVSIKSDTTANLTKGYTTDEFDGGTQSSGTFTPDFTDEQIQKLINGGAFTLAPPSGNGSCWIDITNNASAGAITTSGFTKVLGDSFTTTNTDKFSCHIKNSSIGSILTIAVLQ